MPTTTDHEPPKAGLQQLPKPILVALIALFVASVYWPVRHGGFIWDDIINFVENDWLSSGSQWQHYVLRDFNGWTNYFRPIGVALFAVQVRLFENQPGPMHLVSLAMHVGNTILVGALASLAMRISSMANAARTGWLAACMLLYGLHPALIETVAWVGTQFDQLATGFMLIGAISAFRVKAQHARAAVIGLCFFLALCSKESAVVFPPVLLLVGWIVHARSAPNSDTSHLLRTYFISTIPVIVALAVAMAAYLAFRIYGLGHLLQHTPSHGGDLPLVGSIQKVTWTLLNYFRIIAYPWRGLNPIHTVEQVLFTTIRPGLLLAFLACCGMIAWSIQATCKQVSVSACVILVITFALLPVLNIAPTDFAFSLYHERYAINSIAFGIVLLPLISWPIPKALSSSVKRFLIVAFATVWVTSSILTIRSTVPFWLDDERLWRWAVAENPASELAQYNTTAALLRNGKLVEANKYSEQFADSGNACARCDIQLAIFELRNENTSRADELLARTKLSREVERDLDVRGDYLLTAGQLAMAQRRHGDAATLLAQGMEIHPARLHDKVNFATALWETGRRDEAVAAANEAVELADMVNRPLIAKWRSLLEAELNLKQSNDSARDAE